MNQLEHEAETCHASKRSLGMRPETDLMPRHRDRFPRTLKLKNLRSTAPHFYYEITADMKENTSHRMVSLNPVNA